VTPQKDGGLFLTKKNKSDFGRCDEGGDEVFLRICRLKRKGEGMTSGGR